MRKHEVVVQLKFKLGSNRHMSQYKAHCMKWGCRWKTTTASMNAIIDRGQQHAKRFKRTKHA